VPIIYKRNRFNIPCRPRK